MKNRPDMNQVRKEMLKDFSVCPICKRKKEDIEKETTEVWDNYMERCYAKYSDRLKELGWNPDSPEFSHTLCFDKWEGYHPRDPSRNVFEIHHKLPYFLHIGEHNKEDLIVICYKCHGKENGKVIRAGNNIIRYMNREIREHQ